MAIVILSAIEGSVVKDHNPQHKSRFAHCTCGYKGPSREEGSFQIHEDYGLHLKNDVIKEAVAEYFTVLRYASQPSGIPPSLAKALSIGVGALPRRPVALSELGYELCTFSSTNIMGNQIECLMPVTTGRAELSRIRFMEVLCDLHYQQAVERSL